MCKLCNFPARWGSWIKRLCEINKHHSNNLNVAAFLRIRHQSYLPGSKRGHCQLDMHPTTCLRGSSWPARMDFFLFFQNTIYSCWTTTGIRQQGQRGGPLARGEVTTTAYAVNSFKSISNPTDDTVRLGA